MLGPMIHPVIHRRKSRLGLRVPAVGFEDFVAAGVADGARGEFHVEGYLVRDELFLGIEHHFLSDLFAGVGGGTGHDGG